MALSAERYQVLHQALSRWSREQLEEIVERTSTSSTLADNCFSLGEKDGLAGREAEHAQGCQPYLTGYFKGRGESSVC